MARANVRDFVRHHSREFRFLIRVQDQAAVDVEKSARQRERIHHVRIDHLDCERHLRVGVAHQVLPHAVHVFRDHRVVDEFRALLDFLGQLLAQRDVVFERIQLEAVAHLRLPMALTSASLPGFTLGLSF